MASDTILSYSVDLSKVAEALATIPDQAGAEGAKAAERLSKALNKATKLQNQILKAQREAADASKLAAAAAKLSEEATKNQRDSFLELAEMAGGPSKDSMDKLSKAFAAFGPAGGIAAVAAVGVATAVAAAAVASVAAAVGIVALVHGAGDLARSLQEVEKVGGATSTIGVSQSQIDAFDQAAASLDSISLLAQQFGLVMASELAPAVETGARAVLKIALMSRDFFNELSGGEGVLKGFATFAAQGLVAALLKPVEALALMVRGFAGLARLSGLDAIADQATGLADMWSTTRNKIASAGLELVFDASSKAVGFLSDQTKDYDGEIDALIGTQARYTKVTRESADAAKDAADRERELAEARAHAAAVAQALEKAVGKTSSASEALRLEEAETIAALVEHKATEQQIAEARAAYADRRVRLTEETTDRVLELEQGAYAALLSAVDSYTSGRLTSEEKLDQGLASVQADIVSNAKRAQDELDKIAESARAGGDLEAVKAAEAAKIQLAEDTQAALTAASEEGARQRTELAVQEARAQSEVIASAVSSTIGDLGAAFSAYSGLVRDNYQTTLDEISSLSEAALDAENKRRERNGQSAIEMDQLVASEQVKLLEKKAKRQKGILIGLFAAEQAAALAQVVIDTALGFSAVTAAYAANPPLMLGLQALVVSSGVAQAAAISAARPSFHRGGVVPQASAGQGEVLSRLLPGEVVLNRQTVDRMGGASAADRMNRGGSVGSGQIVVVQQYGHRTFEEVVYDDVRRPDSSLRRAVKGSTRVGHRSR